jgi:hypothetical protein
MIHDGRRIVLADGAARLALYIEWHPPRLMDELVRYTGQFRQPAPHKKPLGVVLPAL